MTLPRIVALIGIALGALAPASAQSSDFIASGPLHDAGLKKFWQITLPLEADQEIASGHLVDDQLYLMTNDGYVFAVHADTGVTRWVKRVTRGGYPLWRPCHTNDRTLFVTPAVVSMYDRVYGTPIEQIDLDFPAGSAGATDGRLLFLGGIDQRCYAFDLTTGYEVWKFRTDGQIVAQPTVFEGAVYVASDDGGVYSCNARNRAYRWIFRTAGSLKASPVVDANGVYIASTDHSLYLIEKNTGWMRWQARLSGPLDEPPVVTPEVAYQYGREDGLVAVNTHGMGDDERIRWKLPDGRMLLTLDDQRAYVLSRDQRLLVVDKASGAVEHEIEAWGFLMGMPAPADHAVYVASRSGRVFCARSLDAPFPRAAEVREALFTKREAEATTQPAEPEAADAASKAMVDPLAQPTSRPVTGKSKVTRGFGGGAP